MDPTHPGLLLVGDNMGSGKGILPTCYETHIIPFLDEDTLGHPISIQERRSTRAFCHPRWRKMTMGEFPGIEIATYRIKRLGWVVKVVVIFGGRNNRIESSIDTCGTSIF